MLLFYYETSNKKKDYLEKILLSFRKGRFQRVMVVNDYNDSNVGPQGKTL